MKKGKNLLDQAKNKIETIEQLFDEIKELQQNRSNFALEKFVVLQHDMPGRQRKQVLDELLSMMMGMQQTISAYEMAAIDIEEYSKTDPGKSEYKRHQVKLREKMIEINIMEIQITGQMREVNFLLNMLNQIPKITRAQLEAEESEYWTRRLTRQTKLAMFGGNQGNIDAVLQMLSELGKARSPVNLGLEEIITMAGYELKKIESTGKED